MEFPIVPKFFFYQMLFTSFISKFDIHCCWMEFTLSQFAPINVYVCTFPVSDWNDYKALGVRGRKREKGKQEYYVESNFPRHCIFLFLVFPLLFFSDILKYLFVFFSSFL